MGESRLNGDSKVTRITLPNIHEKNIYNNIHFNIYDNIHEKNIYDNIYDT